MKDRGLQARQRIGWLLQAARTSAGIPLQSFNGHLDLERRTSAATLSRIENAGTLDGQIIAAYERALDLPHGHLRSAAILQAIVGNLAATGLNSVRLDTSLNGFSAACEAVADSPTGPDWLRFADYHEKSHFGLTSTTMLPLVKQLASEIQAAGGVGFRQRLAAFIILRRSAYANLVGIAADDAMGRAGGGNLDAIAFGWAAVVGDDVLGWAIKQLNEPSARLFAAACVALETLALVGNAAEADWAENAEMIQRQIAAMPADRRRRATDVLSAVPNMTDSAAPAQSEAATPTARSTSKGLLVGVVGAQAVGSAILTDLLAELLYERRTPLVIASAAALAASPYGPALHQRLLQTAERSGSEELRKRSARAALAMRMPAITP